MNKLLSVCMIVRNEENVLERCLRSLHGIADEIIVVDTGSTDRTKEIAMKYTDKVYDFKWVNDFSKARNFSASKATGDWILIVDADEFVDRESFKRFKEELSTNPPEFEINAVEIINFIGANADATAKNLHTRLYKNNGKIKFYRPIHEVLRYENGSGNFGVVNLQLFHSGYMSDTVKEKNKIERNLSLLLNQKNKTGIDYYYIGNEYKRLGDLDKAILYYQKSFRERESTHANYLTKLLVSLIDSLYVKERYKDALEVIKGCEEGYPNYADYKYYKGLIYYVQKNYAKAKEVFENILVNKDHLIVDHSEEFKEYRPLIYLAEIYEQEENLEKAVEYYSKAISIDPKNDMLWSKLLFILGKHSSLEELTGFINRKVVPSTGMTEQRMIQILLNVPLLNVQKLTRSLLDHENLTDLENEALWLKNYLLDLNFKEVHSLVENKTPGELTLLMQTKIFTIEDLFIQVHEFENEKTMDKLVKLSQLYNITNLISLLFAAKYKKMTLNQNEEYLFVNMYRQAKVLGANEMIKKLNSKRFLLNEQNREQINKISKL